MKLRIYVVFAACVFTSLFLTFPASASVGDDGGILEVFDFVLDGLVGLFVPSEDYFSRSFSRIRDNFSSKFGGIIATANYLSNAFSNLQSYRGSSGLFVLKFPENHLFGGKSVNLISGGEGIFNMLRMALSGSIVLYTVAFAYKRVISMIRS